MSNDPLKRWKLADALATLIIVLVIPYCWVRESGRVPSGSAGDLSAKIAFVGSESCKDCHRAEYDKWADAHHRWAMAPATEKTVLGDFNNAVFEHFGVQSRFYRKEGRYFVHTQGPDGKMGEYEITHTFPGACRWTTTSIATPISSTTGSRSF